MKIKKVLYIFNGGSTAILECEHCGHEQKRTIAEKGALVKCTKCDETDRSISDTMQTWHDYDKKKWDAYAKERWDKK